MLHGDSSPLVSALLLCPFLRDICQCSLKATIPSKVSASRRTGHRVSDQQHDSDVRSAVDSSVVLRRPRSEQ